LRSFAGRKSGCDDDAGVPVRVHAGVVGMKPDSHPWMGCCGRLSPLRSSGYLFHVRPEQVDAVQFMQQRFLYAVILTLPAGHTAYIRRIHAQPFCHARVKTKMQFVPFQLGITVDMPIVSVRFHSSPCLYNNAKN
jgi:hypothetical protein